MARRGHRGFSLLEMSVVLVIIAVIVGAVTMGGDVLRNANGQRLFSDFIVGWSQAFQRYVSVAKVVPGDDPKDPQNIIVGAGGSSLLCNGSVPALSNLMLAQGIQLPAGRSAGMEDRYVYQDGNGAPHELRVCFTTRPWSVPGTAVGIYVLENRHVMRITGLTSELATQLDSLVDGRPDARFGRFRMVSEAASLSSSSVQWPPVRTSAGDENIDEVQADMEM